MTRDGADDASAVAAWSPPVAIWRNVRADGVRSVRVGVQTSVLALGTLAIYACLPGHGVVAMRGFIPLLVSAIVAVVAVRLLPWERMFRTSLGLFMMYVWSTVDILLISVAIVFTGGGRSELWVLYALTTLFFAALYPPRVQGALLAFSEASYIVTILATGWHITLAALFLHTALLAIVFVMAMFLAIERDTALDGLAHQAHHDPQTGLLRRQTFMRVLEHTLEQPPASGIVGVMFVDLDHFKQINDTHGHHVGDAVIETVARRLIRCVREDDVVARFGGDEFVALCWFDSAGDAHEAGERVAAAINQPIDVTGLLLTPSASIGIACNTSIGAAPTGEIGAGAAETLLRDADAAMYESKRSRRAAEAA